VDFVRTAPLRHQRTCPADEQEENESYEFIKGVSLQIYPNPGFQTRETAKLQFVRTWEHFFGRLFEDWNLAVRCFWAIVRSLQTADIFVW
jgi:hypothetical protein